MHRNVTQGTSDSVTVRLYRLRRFGFVKVVFVIYSVHVCITITLRIYLYNIWYHCITLMYIVWLFHSRYPPQELIPTEPGCPKNSWQGLHSAEPPLYYSSGSTPYRVAIARAQILARDVLNGLSEDTVCCCVDNNGRRAQVDAQTLHNYKTPLLLTLAHEPCLYLSLCKA